MLVVCSFSVVYPGALLAFIWAPVKVQWVWLGYLVYTMVAMHLYRFNVWSGQHIATTEARVARALQMNGRVVLSGLSGQRVLAELHTETAEKISVRKERVKLLVASILADSP